MCTKFSLKSVTLNSYEFQFKDRPPRKGIETFFKQVSIQFISIMRMESTRIELENKGRGRGRGRGRANTFQLTSMTSIGIQLQIS